MNNKDQKPSNDVKNSDNDEENEENGLLNMMCNTINLD